MDTKAVERDEWKVTYVYCYSKGATFSLNTVSHTPVITVIQDANGWFRNTSSPNEIIHYFWELEISQGIYT